MIGSGITVKMRQTLYLLLGLVLTLLGIVGAFLPVIPTTVFLIGALFCFTQSSPKLEKWLLEHPKYGETLRAWRLHGVVSKRVKCIACSSMLLSFIVLCIFASLPLLAYIGTAVFMGIGAYYLITRPSEPVGNCDMFRSKG